ncbi:MAG TPA: aminotransferase class I/II-fold pyridoxal phosphate-dependent enzyme [Terriglobales bacterium]|nr:aminotransferase class I/II-fold pyridoxal phosphate-dependent enzyme [Terriglobales bacterium]
MPQLSQRAAHISQSDIRTMSVECERVRGVNLAQGICDTPVPPEVRAAAERAIESGQNQYTRLDGVGALRQAIAEKMRAFNGIEADPEREIVVTVGSTGAFYCASLSMLNPGDEVLLFEPYYGYHVHTVEAVGGVPRYITLRSPDWKFEREDLQRAISPRTRAIVVNTPANPSGKVFTRTELQWIAEVAQEHDLFVFTDEIYEYFVYDDAGHISIATLPGMGERTITISGYSKTFSITGWRIGYAVCSTCWAGAIGYYSDLAYICAPAPLQHAVAAGIKVLPESFYAGLRRDYKRKRDLLCRALAEAGFTCGMPAGSYYLLADASRLPGKNSKDRAMHLLETAGVAAVPGGAFYHDKAGENLLRFCYAKTDADLEEACRRLQRVLVRS